MKVGKLCIYRSESCEGQKVSRAFCYTELWFYLGDDIIDIRSSNVTPANSRLISLYIPVTQAFYLLFECLGYLKSFR